MTEEDGTESRLMKIRYVKKRPSGETKRMEKQRQGLTRYETAMGGRERLIELLQSSDLDVKQQKLLNLIADPANSHISLATLAHSAGIKPVAMLTLLRDTQSALAFAEAHAVMSAELPGVIADVATKAQDHSERCACTLGPGDTEQPPLPDCPKCGGRGFFLRSSSLEHQQLFLEAIGMLKKGGGVNVQVQQQTGVVVGKGFFDKFVKATDRAALDVIDAEEVVETGN